MSENSSKESSGFNISDLININNVPGASQSRVQKSNTNPVTELTKGESAASSNNLQNYSMPLTANDVLQNDQRRDSTFDAPALALLKKKQQSPNESASENNPSDPSCEPQGIHQFNIPSLADNQSLTLTTFKTGSTTGTSSTDCIDAAQSALKTVKSDVSESKRLESLRQEYNFMGLNDGDINESGDINSVSPLSNTNRKKVSSGSGNSSTGIMAGLGQPGLNGNATLETNTVKGLPGMSSSGSLGGDLLSGNGTAGHVNVASGNSESVQAVLLQNEKEPGQASLVQLQDFGVAPETLYKNKELAESTTPNHSA